MAPPAPLPLRAYLLASAAADLAAPAVLRRRLAAGKEDGARLAERTGHSGAPRPAGPLVWLHAASVGESLSLLTLVARLRAARPDATVLVTTGTVTSAQLMAERLPEGALHQFAPLDTARAVGRFLDHWHPDLAVWAESELWPRLITVTRGRGTPMLLVNARMTDRSVRRWRRLPRSAAALLGAFDAVLAQDTATAAALTGLGAPPDRLTVSGTLKQSAEPPGCDADALARLRTVIGARPVWLAASTHPGEEALAAEAHAALLARAPETLLIVAPRHPARGDEAARALARFATARRSAGDTPEAATQVYLADTLGEMGLWYRLAPISFVGGSFDGVGGHNPFEPAALGSAILHGPDVTNFAEIYAALDAADAARPVRSAAELAEAVAALDPAARTAMAERAREVAAAESAALDLALDAILSRLPG